MTTEQDLNALIAVELFGWGWVRCGAPAKHVGRYLLPAEEFDAASRGELLKDHPFVWPANGDEFLMNDWDYLVLEWTHDWGDMRQVIEEREQSGFHWQLKTPFAKGCEYSAGLTPLGVSGWNGVPDYFRSASTLPLAVALAALASLGLDVRYRPIDGEARP